MADTGTNAVLLECDGSSGDRKLEGQIASIFSEIFNLWKERQSKYGPGNIAAFGEVGCLVRGHDKMARLKRALMEHIGVRATDESVEDSWKDLTNYAIMGLACRRGLWPGVKP